MTEDEAKTKWCPFVKPDYRGPDRQNDTYMRCIGSACMAWRWDGIQQNGKPIRNAIAAEHARVGDYDPRTEKPMGCCGLAGKP